MRPNVTRPAPIDAHPRGWRRAGRLDQSRVLPEEPGAAKVDGAAEAQRLIDDVIALLNAGLIVAVSDRGETRYAVADPDNLAADQEA